MKTLSIQVLVLNRQKQVQANLKVQLWFDNTDKDDRLLGEAVSGSDGLALFSFVLSDEELKKKPAMVYVLVYERDKLLYGKKNMPQFQLVKSEDRLKVEVDRVPQEEDAVKATQALVQKFRRSNLQFDDLKSLDAKEKAFVQAGLDQYLKERIIGILGIQEESVQAVIRQLPLSSEKYKDQTLGQVITEAIIPAFKQDEKTAAWLKNIIAQDVEKNGRPVKDLLQLEIPLAQHPAFSKAVRDTKVQVLADITSLDKKVAERMLESGIAWENAPESEWDKLVEEGVINEAQKTQLQHTFNLGKLTGDQFSIVGKLSKDERVKEAKDLARWEAADWSAALESSGGETPNGETKEDYVRNVMRAVERSFPTGFFMARAVKADKPALQNDLSRIAPLLKKNPGLFSGNPVNWEDVPEDQRQQAEKSLASLQGIGQAWRHLGVKEIMGGKGKPEDKAKAIAEAAGALDAFYRGNPALDLRRSNFIKKPGSEASQLDWSGVPEAMQPKVQRQMLAFQRTHLLAPDYATSDKLMRKGMDSAYHITNRNQRQFIAESGLEEAVAAGVYANAQRTAAFVAHQMHAIRELHHNQLMGLRVDNTITHRASGFSMVGNSVQTRGPVQPGNGQNGNSNGNAPSLYDSLKNELKDIDGYAELFGPQNFCQCDHCKSIFSPAAYFVDMMHFIEQNVKFTKLGVIMDPLNPLDPFYSTVPISLINRRPDLWCLELTCDCTYKMIPYLEIMNGVKEHYIKYLNGWGSLMEEFPDCKRMTEYDVYKRLFETHSEHIFFYSPISEPYYEMLILLERFGVSLSEILEANRVAGGNNWFAYLKMQPVELMAGSSPFRLFGGKTTFDTMTVTEFLKHSKISRRELDDLLATNYIGTRGFVKIEKEAFDAGIQYFDEKIVNIEQNVLSHIHYFIRFWKKLPWTIKEFDLVLSTLHTKLPPPGGSPPAFQSAHVEAVVQLLQLQEILSVTVEELISIVHIMPNISLKSVEKTDPLTQELYVEKTPGFLERRFDFKKIFGNILSVTAAPETEARAHFLAGLGLKNEEFNFLQGSESDPVLSRNDPAVFTFYYRHAKLAKALRLSLKEWQQFLELTKDPQESLDQQKLKDVTIKKIHWLVEHAKIWKTSPFSFGELLWLTKQYDFPYPVEDEELKKTLQVEELPAFSGDILKAIDNVVFDDAAVDGLLQKMVLDGIVTETEEDGMFQMTAEFDWAKLESATIAIDPILWSAHENELKLAFSPYYHLWAIAGLYWKKESLLEIGALGEPEVAALLQGLLAGNLVQIIPGDVFLLTHNSYDKTSLEGIINVLPTSTLEEEAVRMRLKESTDSIDQLLRAHTEKAQYEKVWKSFTGFGPDMVDAIQPYLENDWLTGFYAQFSETVADGIPVNFRSFVKEMKLLGLLTDKLNLTPISARFIYDHQSDVFDFASIKTSALLNLTNIRKLTNYMKWVDLDKEAVESILHPLLIGIKSDEQQTAAAFRHYFGVDEAITLSLYQAPQLKNLDLAETFRDRALLCQKLDISGKQLAEFNNQTYDAAKKLSSLLHASFRTQYEDEAKFEEAFDPYRSKINELKRDILCDYILAKETDFNFKDANELYAFFLLDPQMGGCMKISKVVAAHQSIQLYLHRVLMNLEQNEIEELNPQTNILEKKTTTRAYLTPDAMQEWEWRKNYRVWEANRKVTAYAENLLEPEWRDNKSPEFKQLEDELLQQKITLESAEGAYKQYLKGFAEVAQLIVAGVYYHDGTPEKPYPTYHIFGRTATDPYQYYYRKLYILRDDIKKTESKDYTPWVKVELPISAPFVSAFYFRSKFFLFWVEVVHSPDVSITPSELKTTRYDHKVTLKYSYLDESGKWIQPQMINYLTKDDEALFTSSSSPEVRNYEKSRSFKTVYPFELNGQLYVNYEFANHEDPPIIQSYLSKGRNYRIDFFKNKLTQLWSHEVWIDGLHLPDYWQPALSLDQDNVLLLKRATNQVFTQIDELTSAIPNVSGYLILTNFFPYKTLEPDIRQVNPNLRGIDTTNSQVVSRHTGDSYLTLGGDSFLFRYLYNNVNKDIIKLDANWSLYTEKALVDNELECLNTSVVEDFQTILYNEGLNAFLQPSTQTIVEKQLPFSVLNQTMLYYTAWVDMFIHKRLSFGGAHGLYFWELFFHIPSLIADHLNAEGKYKEADWWYHKIFDPTATEDGNLSNPVDRNWQFLPFRGQEPAKYSVDLTDGAAIEVYKKDPFNPHAIARLRISAYQKATVMKYIDNLLDWADSLFRKDTFESINEAMMLYVLAQDILGERPKELCKCETADDSRLTYTQISTALKEGSDFLIWMENLHHQWVQKGFMLQTPFSSGASAISSRGAGGPLPAAGLVLPAGSLNNVQKYDLNVQGVGTGMADKFSAGFSQLAREAKQMVLITVTTQRLVFCVPMNKRMLELWDRVENRLFKIRHCMNIDGVRRSLSLFAPVIDPALLVAARAAGLSIADAIASLDAPVPNYRFSFMLEKARGFAGTVQSFGGALLSALEKKDGEELTLLRSVHEQNILKMTKDIKKQQIEENKAQIKNLEETKKNIQNRVDYYSGLIDVGLIPWERTQQIATHTSSVLYGVEAIFGTLSSILSFLPQVGAPTAMTYGGIQVSKSMAYAGNAINSAAKAASLLATSAGLEAGNKRREQEWKNQLKLSEQEIKAIDQQIAAAQIRLAISEKDLQIHETQIEQAKELHDFYKEKFTNLGLYKYMATTLSRLYNQAYNLAFDLAKKAEKCYQFETGEATQYFIKNDNWDSGYAGLLAGERLLLQLQQMEKSFLEKTPRREEVRQSFSLRLINPAALQQLTQDGECTFGIPEAVFDLYYPGHYRRIIKSVLFTIPCVVGPYVNVPARFSLTKSQIRTEPRTGVDNIFSGPNSAHTTIATSSANNDGGQFELNFQDIRYLPFEGGGAVNSEWSLSLPNQFRPFDYNTIQDVIVHISYSAKFDGGLKTKVENELMDMLNGMPLQRLISLKAEFPDVLYALENNQSNVKLEVRFNHFPFVFKGREISLNSVGLSGSPDVGSPENEPQTGTLIGWNIPLVKANIDDGDVWVLLEYSLA